MAFPDDIILDVSWHVEVRSIDVKTKLKNAEIACFFSLSHPPKLRFSQYMESNP